MPTKKILFVEPSGAPSNVFAKFMAIPLLGPIYLATIARKAGHDATVFNENIMKRSIRTADMVEADVLCLSCLTATIGRGKVIAQEYRAARRHDRPRQGDRTGISGRAQGRRQTVMGHGWWYSRQHDASGHREGF